MSPLFAVGGGIVKEIRSFLQGFFLPGRVHGT